MWTLSCGLGTTEPKAEERTAMKRKGVAEPEQDVATKLVFWLGALDEAVSIRVLCVAAGIRMLFLNVLQWDI